MDQTVEIQSFSQTFNIKKLSRKSAGNLIYALKVCYFTTVGFVFLIALERKLFDVWKQKLVLIWSWNFIMDILCF